MDDQSARGPVSVEWAVIAKYPGAEEDYGIIAGSGGNEDIDDLNKIAFRYLAGNPSNDLRGREDLPHAPPWATFGTHPPQHQGGARFISAAIQRQWHGAVDDSRRPIWPRHFFAYRYQDVARRHVSFTTAYQAVSGVPLSWDDPRPLRPVMSHGLRGAAGDALLKLAGERFDWLAGVAALLLEGQVVIDGASRLPLARRLQLLDAIAAMLPYGYRADLSASSAIGTGYTRMRLILADKAVDYGLHVKWNGAVPAPQHEHAIAYHSMLTRKASAGVREILSYLWNHVDECTFPEPSQTLEAISPALEILYEFNRLDDLEHRVRGSRGVVRHEAEELFSESQDAVADIWDRLSPSQRDQLFSTVIESQAPDAARDLARHWPTVVEDAIRLAQARLDEGDHILAERIMRFVESNLTMDDADGLLAALLFPPKNRVASAESLAPGAINARVALMRGRRLPEPGEYPNTCGSLRFQPVGNWQPSLVYRLLTEELNASPERARRWVAWLCESASPQLWSGSDPRWHRPDWMVALAYIATTSALPGDEASLVELTDHPGWATLFLRLAKLTQRLPAALKALDLRLPRLAERVIAPDANAYQSPLAGVLAESLTGTSLSEAELAVVDATRMILTGMPVDFPHHRPEQQVLHYLAGWNRVFSHFDENTGDRGQLQHALLERVIPPETAERSELTPGVITLIAAWVRDKDRVSVLAYSIVSLKIQNLLLRHRELNHIWAQLKEFPQLADFAAVGQLKEVAAKIAERPGAGIFRVFTRTLQGRFEIEMSALAEAIHDAYRGGMNAESILDALAGVWLGAVRGAGNFERLLPVRAPEFAEVLRQCQTLLLEFQPDGDGHRRDTRDVRAYAGEMFREFSGLIVHKHALGELFAREYATVVAPELAKRAEYYSGLARELANDRKTSQRWLRKYYQWKADNPRVSQQLSRPVADTAPGPWPPARPPRPSAVAPVPAATAPPPAPGGRTTVAGPPALGSAATVPVRARGQHERQPDGAGRRNIVIRAVTFPLAVIVAIAHPFRPRSPEGDPAMNGGDSGRTGGPPT
jgi:hypothetical protein